MDYFDEEYGQPIAQDYQNAIEEIISREFVNRNNALQLNYENAIKRVKELTDKNYQLLSEKKNLELSFEKSIVEARRNGKLDAMSEITGGYTLGQKLYHPYPEYENVTCDVCGGSNRVIILQKSDGKEIDVKCPRCNNGTVNITKYKPVEVYINDMHIYMEDETAKGYWKANCKFEKEIKTSTRYTATSKTWEDRDVRLSECFSTIEECQQECDSRNSKLIISSTQS